MSAEAISRYVAREPRRSVPSTLHAARVLFYLGARELVLSRKTLVVLLLGSLLVFASLLFNLSRVLGWVGGTNVSLFFGVLVTESFMRFLLPMVALFYGAALVTDEVDGRTLTYLTTRPIDKRVILWGKFSGFFAVAVVLLETTLFLCWLAFATVQGPAGMVTHFHLLAKDGFMVLLGILAYGSFFTFLGAALRKPVIPGLLFIFVWELFVSFLPGSAQRLTVLHYLQSLTPHVMSPSSELGFLSSIVHPEPVWLALPALLIFSGLFLFLAGGVFHAKEYRLEK